MQFPPPDNPSSWAYVFTEIDRFPDDEVWRAYKTNIKQVLDRCIADHLHEDFRAGMAMRDVIFSTAAKHGLKNGEPQVAMSYKSSETGFYVAYATRPLVWGDPMSIETVGGAEQAYELLTQYLLRLWKETKPNLPIPPGLLR